jgi:cell pole-organizing protein PopZ
MEDILASIRRILSEDEVAVPPLAGPARKPLYLLTNPSLNRLT